MQEQRQNQVVDQAVPGLQKQESSITDTQDVKMTEEKNLDQVDITTEGKNYIGSDVVSTDFMSKIRKI